MKPPASIVPAHDEPLLLLRSLPRVKPASASLNAGTRSVPETPTIPDTVDTGDVITAAHENTVVNALDDLWTDVQALDAAKLEDPTTAKGDLLVRGVSVVGALPVGADDELLIADSTTSSGLRWDTIPTASQTPWTSDIDAANHALDNLQAIGIGGASSGPSVAITVHDTAFGGANYALAFDSLNATGLAGIHLGNDLLHGFEMLIVASGAGVTPDTAILMSYGSDLSFVTGTSVGTIAQRIRITTSGLVGIAKYPTTYALEVAGDIDLTSGHVYRINGTPLTASVQTPWGSAIDAFGFDLQNVGKLGIGGVPTTWPLEVYASGANAVASLETYNTSNPLAGFIGKGARGTLASPSALQSGDAACVVLGWGYGASAWGANTGQINFVATENFTNTAKGMAIALHTAANGSVSLLERMRVDHDGQVGIGTTSPGYALDVTGDINCSGAFRVGGSLIGSGLLTAAGMYLYDGTNYYVPPQMQIATLPVAANFTWVNQGSATEASVQNALVMTAPAVAGTNWRLRVMSIGSNTVLTACMSITMEFQNYRYGALVFRESATGKIVSFGFIVNAGSLGLGLQISRYSNSTTFVTTPFSYTWDNGLHHVWCRISITSGTTLNFFQSQDGVNFVKIYSEAKTAGFTTGPDQWGWGLDPELSGLGQSSDLYNMLLSWKTA